jgi:hypothetical protein
MTRELLELFNAETAKGSVKNGTKIRAVWDVFEGATGDWIIDELRIHRVKYF